MVAQDPYDVGVPGDRPEARAGGPALDLGLGLPRHRVPLAQQPVALVRDSGGVDAGVEDVRDVRGVIHGATVTGARPRPQERGRGA